jgi:hypothetical protein
VEIKNGKVLEQDKFNKKVDENFTPYCRPLIPCVQELCDVVFPGGKRWLEEDRELYVRMKSVLEKTRNYLDTTLDTRDAAHSQVLVGYWYNGAGIAGVLGHHRS